MARPMTAADRAPQVGDVLRWRRYARPIAWVDGGLFAYGGQTFDWTHRERGDGYNSIKDEFSIWDGKNHIYVSRRDGGPVIVEED